MTTTYIKNVLGTDFLTGFKITWVSATSLKISSGAAALLSGQFIVSNSDITLSSMTLSASTWYHLYLASATSIEYSTTAPAAAYFGVARTKTGDTTRRYLGSFLTNSSAQIPKFRFSNGWVHFRARISCLVGGTATSYTAVSLINAIPETATMVNLALTNTGSANGIVTTDTGNVQIVEQSGGRGSGILSIQNRTLYYYVVSGGSLGIDVLGYFFER